MGKPSAASRPRDLAAEVLIARSPRLGPQHTCGRASGPQRTQGRALHIALRVPLPCTAPGGRAERWLWRLVARHSWAGFLGPLLASHCGKTLTHKTGTTPGPQAVWLFPRGSLRPATEGSRASPGL